MALKVLRKKVKDKKMFTKFALKVNPRNRQKPLRGGIRF